MALITPPSRRPAALTGDLLARKGFARPAMRSPLAPGPHRDGGSFALDDLGWNDLGDDACVPAPSGAIDPEAGRMARLIRIPPGSRRPPGTALSEGRRAGFTLRLDAGRHTALRRACGLTNQSAQTLLTAALDRLLADMGFGNTRCLLSRGNRNMTAIRSRAHARLPLRSAFTAALLIGAAQHTASAHEVRAHDRIASELRKGNTARAVELGEAAVAVAPQDAALRAELGHAYLRAGRFEAAAAALNGALTLGDTAPRTTLVLALAQIACGQTRAALATLDRGADIPAADLGLALALAGDTGRGVAVLTDAVRDGAPSPVLRQNLAYAYALDGRWADATLTAGFDLPPDQVNERLQQWAGSMTAGGERVRIARLMNVPLIADVGMPVALALNVAQPGAAPTPATVTASPEPVPVAQSLPAAELSVDAAPPVQIVTSAASPASAAAVHADAPRAFGHFVQLAAYHSYRSAERGKQVLAKRHAQLRGHGLMIAQATVHGRAYWTVVLASSGAASARSTCSSLRRNGTACFAYSSRPAKRDQALALADTPAVAISRRR